MPPSARITFRLTPTLEALVSDCVRQGHSVSDIVRDALETYFGLRQTSCPTESASVSDSILRVSDKLSDDVSDISAKLSDLVSDVSDMRERLGQLEARLDVLSPDVRQRQTPRPTPQAGPATAPSPATLPAHIQRIAETAMQYDKLSLAELSHLLFDRGIYRATDRQTGEAKPVNRGTLQKWLDQARHAGVL
jgi:hypothetical protein